MSKLTTKKSVAVFGAPIPPIENSEPRNGKAVSPKDKSSKSENLVCNFRIPPSATHKLNELRQALLKAGVPRADAGNGAVVTLLIDAATPEMVLALYRASIA